MADFLSLVFITLISFYQNRNFGKFAALAFFGGLVVDLLYGSFIGSTSCFLLLELVLLLTYSGYGRLRIRLKVASSLIFCLIYVYVFRRFLF